MCLALRNGCKTLLCTWTAFCKWQAGWRLKMSEWHFNTSCESGHFFYFYFTNLWHPQPALPCLIHRHMLLYTLVWAFMTFPVTPPYSHSTNKIPYIGGQSRWCHMINLDMLTVRSNFGKPSLFTQVQSGSHPHSGPLNELLHPEKYKSLCKVIAGHSPPWKTSKTPRDDRVP